MELNVWIMVGVLSIANIIEAIVQKNWHSALGWFVGTLGAVRFVLLLTAP